MNAVSTVGIDLAKSVFSVHAVDAQGKVVVRRTVSRTKLSAMVAQLPPCLIGMEACSGAHEWARRFTASGHTVKLMAAAAPSTATGVPGRLTPSLPPERCAQETSIMISGSVREAEKPITIVAHEASPVFGSASADLMMSRAPDPRMLINRTDTRMQPNLAALRI